MYVLTHEMGHALHESLPQLSDQLRATNRNQMTNQGSLVGVVTNLLSRQSAEDGAVMKRADAVELAKQITTEAEKISRRRRPSQWAQTDVKVFGVRDTHADRLHEYLNRPQELLADVGATMLEDPASIRNTEIYSLLKNLFGKGVYKDVIKFGAFGGLTLPQILQMSEQNEQQG